MAIAAIRGRSTRTVTVYCCVNTTDLEEHTAESVHIAYHEQGSVMDNFTEYTLDFSELGLKDVARVEFGAYTYTSSNVLNGLPASGFGVVQTPGSNANEIITELERQLNQFSANLPSGMKFKVIYNSKEFLDSSIDQVKETVLRQNGYVSEKHCGHGVAHGISQVLKSVGYALENLAEKISHPTTTK